MRSGVNASKKGLIFVSGVVRTSLKGFSTFFLVIFDRLGIDCRLTVRLIVLPVAQQNNHFRSRGYVSFLLFVFLFVDLTKSISPIQNLSGRGRRVASIGMVNIFGIGPAHPATHPPPHHKETEDHHRDRKYPPPMPEFRRFVSSHGHHLLSCHPSSSQFFDLLRP